jgi:hypothetical protein
MDGEAVNSVTPPDDNKSLTHDQWIETFDRLLAKNGVESGVGECAFFCGQVLRKCGHTPELKEFIDQRSIYAYERTDSD